MYATMGRERDNSTPRWMLGGRWSKIGWGANDLGVSDSTIFCSSWMDSSIESMVDSSSRGVVVAGVAMVCYLAYPLWLTGLITRCAQQQ